MQSYIGILKCYTTPSEIDKVITILFIVPHFSKMIHLQLVYSVET